MRWGEQALSVTGEWWIDDPTDTVPGFLEEVPGRGLVLTALGNLSESFPTKPIPEVYGSAFSGVVLTRVALVAGEWSGSAVRRQEFLVESALLRTQTSPSSLSVLAGSVRFTGIESWRVGRALHLRHDGLDVVRAVFERPEVESAAVSSGSVTLRVSDRTSTSTGEVRIKAIPSFHIRLDAPVPYTEFLSEWVARLRNLNSLATSHRSAVVELEVLPPGEDGRPIDVRGGLVEWDSQARPPAMTAFDLDLVPPPEMPGFDLASPSIGFQELVENWWSLCARQRLALDQYFASYYAPDPPASVRLLGHLFVLETLHRHKCPDAVAEPQQEFNDRKKRILDSARWDDKSNDDRKWLKKRPWNRMNDPTLKMRLRSLAELTTALNEVVEDWEQCCHQLEATRNFLAHGLTAPTSEPIPPHEYEPVSRLLDSWIRGLIWYELGFEDSLIKHMLRRTESYSGLRASISQAWIRSSPN